MNASLEKILANPMGVEVKTMLVYGESCLSIDDIDGLTSRGVKLLVLPERMDVCNRYKKKFRQTRCFEIVFSNDLLMLSNIDAVVAFNLQDLSHMPLNIKSQAKFILSRLDINGYYRIDDFILARDQDVIISSSSKTNNEASIIKVLNIKPVCTDYGDGSNIVNGKLAIGVRNSMMDYLKNIPYLDIDVLTFSGTKTDNGDIYVAGVTNAKMMSLLKIMSDAEFKIVISED